MDDDARRQLLERIARRRESIDVFLRVARPRGSRLITTSAVTSAVAAVLTAGPAAGGPDFTSGVQDALALPDESIVWRVLCVVATIASVVAAVTANLSKSRDTVNRIASAELVDAELEGLETVLQFGGVSTREGALRYQQYVKRIPFVDGPALVD